MARIRILVKKNVDSLTREVPYWRMPIEIKMVGVLKELLSIAY
jgi:hypothetical protein